MLLYKTYLLLFFNKNEVNIILCNSNWVLDKPGWNPNYPWCNNSAQKWQIGICLLLDYVLFRARRDTAIANASMIKSGAAVIDAGRAGVYDLVAHKCLMPLPMDVTVTPLTILDCWELSLRMLSARSLVYRTAVTDTDVLTFTRNATVAEKMHNVPYMSRNVLSQRRQKLPSSSPDKMRYNDIDIIISSV